MKDQNNFFPSNLKFLRSRQGLSQEAMAKLLSFTRAKYTSMENGTVKTFSLEDLSAVSQQSGISIDVLVKTDLSKLGELRLRDLLAGNDVYAMGAKVRALAITVDKGNEENIEFVPVSARAGYRSGCSDPEYIAELPRFNLPGLDRGKTYRIFPITGDSMLPIAEDTLVAAEYVRDWTGIKDGTYCIVILDGQGDDIVFKKVENRIGIDRKMVLHSTNPLYIPYEVKVEDVKEIWSMTKLICSGPPAGDISMAQIANSLGEIRLAVGKLAERR